MRPTRFERSWNRSACLPALRLWPPRLLRKPSRFENCKPPRIRPAEVRLKPLCHRLESCVPAEKSPEMFQQAVDRAPVDLEIFLTRMLRSPAIAVSFLESGLETIFFLASISNSRLFDGRSVLSPLPRSMSNTIRKRIVTSLRPSQASRYFLSLSLFIH